MGKHDDRARALDADSSGRPCRIRARVNPRAKAKGGRRDVSRLDHDLGRKRFGDAGYATVELVAEIGATFLRADLGIRPKPLPDHAEATKSVERHLFVLPPRPNAIAGRSQGNGPYGTITESRHAGARGHWIE